MARRVIAVTRDCRTVAITGWRAWLAGVGAVLLAWFVLALIIFLLLGAAITIGLLMLLLVPAIIIAALLSSLMRRAL
jgi:hypothetical protein